MKIDEEKVRKNIQEFQTAINNSGDREDGEFIHSMDKGDLFDNVVQAVVNQIISKGKATDLLEVNYFDFYEYLVKNHGVWLRD